MVDSKTKTSHPDIVMLRTKAEAHCLDIKTRSAEINEEREIPKDLVQSLISDGFFRLLLPESLGGFELNHIDFLDVLEIVAGADGSVAWCLNQNNVLATLAAFMPRKLANVIWSDPNVVLSNGQSTDGECVPVEDGYRLNGTWHFSSGSPHAKWAVALTPITGRKSNNNAPEMRNMLIPKEQVTLVDVWDVNGLKGTGSFSFEVEHLYVPEERSFIEGQPPVQCAPLYLIPKTLLFCSGFATIALGIARSAIDFLIEFSGSKIPQDQMNLKDQAFTQRGIGNAEAILRSARSYLRESANCIWNSAVSEGEISMDTRIDLRLSSTHAIRESLRVMDIVYTLGGSSAIFERSPIQRKFQDVRVISQQIQGRLSHYDTAGQYFLGLTPKDSRF